MKLKTMEDVKRKKHTHTHKWSQLKVELERPAQRNCLAGLTSPAFAMLKWGKITSGLGLQSQCVPRTPVCKDNRKSDTTTPALMAAQAEIKNTV